MRSAKLLAVAAMAALASLGCTPSISGPQASASRLASPVANPAAAVDSKAADLRTRIDLLLGEHVFFVAKASGAVAGNRTSESTAYLGLFSTNESDLADLMRTAFGDTAAAQFHQLWEMLNGSLVEYTIGLATHNQAKATGAMSGILNGFVPQFSQFVATQAQFPLDPATLMTTEQVKEIQAIIDNQAAQDFPKTFADLRKAYAQVSRIGDALASRIATKFPDKFPGDPATKAVDLRVSLNELLQEHAYLASMATAAEVDARTSEQAAALSALGANAHDLSTLFSGLFGAETGDMFDRIWTAKDAALTGYATARDDASKQAALSNLTDTSVSQFSTFIQTSTGSAKGALSTSLQAQVQTTTKVIDGQRAKAFPQAAADDRTAAAEMQLIADLVTNASVTKLSAKFL